MTQKEEISIFVFNAPRVGQLREILPAQRCIALFNLLGFTHHEFLVPAQVLSFPLDADTQDIQIHIVLSKDVQ